MNPVTIVVVHADGPMEISVSVTMDTFQIRTAIAVPTI